MKNSGSFVGGLGAQMTLKLEDKCEVKVKSDLAKIEFDLLMIRAPSTVLIPCFTKPLYKFPLLTQDS